VKGTLPELKTITHFVSISALKHINVLETSEIIGE
jgi:hypothetical protein